jgi:Holliday junction resolvase
VAERDQIEELMHFLLANVLVNSLEKDGFEVRADHLGGLRGAPTPVEGLTPDIEAVKGEDVRLIEVETTSTVGSEDTRRQIQAFAGRPGAKVFLAVPYDTVEAAHKLRDDMDVEFGIIPCYPYVNSIGTPE